MPILAQVFEEEGGLSRLEGFTSIHGAAFYGLPQNTGTITLLRGAPTIWPAKIVTGAGPVTVFDPGFPVHWRVEAQDHEKGAAEK